MKQSIRGSLGARVAFEGIREGTYVNPDFALTLVDIVDSMIFECGSACLN